MDWLKHHKKEMLASYNAMIEYREARKMTMNTEMQMHLKILEQIFKRDYWKHFNRVSQIRIKERTR